MPAAWMLPQGEDFGLEPLPPDPPPVEAWVPPPPTPCPRCARPTPCNESHAYGRCEDCWVTTCVLPPGRGRFAGRAAAGFQIYDAGGRRLTHAGGD